jgi:hypothetical protein
LVGATIIFERYCLGLDDSSEELREQLPTYIAKFNLSSIFSLLHLLLKIKVYNETVMIVSMVVLSYLIGTEHLYNRTRVVSQVVYDHYCV